MALSSSTDLDLIFRKNSRLSLRQHAIGVAPALLVLALVAGLSTGSSQAIAETSQSEAEQELKFNRDIRPILSENCFQCHGPDDDNRSAGLRLDDRDAAIEAGAILEGDPEYSEMIARVTSDDPDVLMPPPWSKKTLTAQQKKILTAWIAQGAEYQPHWSLVAPDRETIKASDAPREPAAAIDHFIQARLKTEGLKPSPQADRAVLLRRVTFDLTGLPPTLEELDSFIADDSPDAYERVVDRLLASPRYGERMASEWLDVARYSDTYGYQVDRDRFVWPWRDWVIRSFNNNLPYDQFVTQQVAGDLLPDATREQQLATTFCRLHPQECEGGSVPEEFRQKHISDRTETFSTAFLGLTMECSRCHDHKFDPIKQKDYYQLNAFFANIDEAGLYSFFTPNSVPTPALPLPTEAQERQLAETAQQVHAAEQRLAAVRKSEQAAFEVWLDQLAITAEKVQPEGNESVEGLPGIPGLVKKLDFEQQVKLPNQQVAGKVGRGAKLTGDDGIEVDAGKFTRAQPFSVATWVNTPDVKDRAVIFHHSRAWTDSASRGYELLIKDGKLRASLIHFWPGNAISVRTKEALPTGQWHHVTMTYDGSSRADGIAIYVDGQQADCEIVKDNLTKKITDSNQNSITIGQRFRDRGFKGGSVDEFHVFERQLTQAEISQLIDGKALTESLASRSPNLSEPQKALLLDYYLSSSSRTYQQALEDLQKARTEHYKVADSVAEIMAMQELSQPRKTFVLNRGEYAEPKDEVFPSTPGALPELEQSHPQNRLGLARWLFSPNHPLTARVAVNRYWQMIFGLGLVRTTEDFGSQGSLPSHPDLLDWLAVDFADGADESGGWNVKRLIKAMVMSSTYRQTSDSSAELLKNDPENILLARGPLVPLAAEMVRDSALVTSGLLDETMGGAPAKPYEVALSFKPVKRDKGSGLYRRSVYTYWQRTSPAPVLMLMDASARDVCRVRRERTASPLQAIALMNGTQFVEAARVLAEKLVAKHGEKTDALVQELYRLQTGLKPTENQLLILKQLFEKQQKLYAAHPERADELIAVGDKPAVEGLSKSDVAAATITTQAVMNLDACVMKR